MRGGWGSLLAVAVVIGGLVFYNWLGSDEDQDDAAANPDRVVSVGEPVTLLTDGWIVTVTGVTTQATLHLGRETKAAIGVYVRVALSFENTKKEADRLDGGDFAITDSQGRKYEPYTRQDEVGSRVNPGLTATGSITFDLPPDDTGLVLKGPGGFRVSLPNVADIPMQ